VDRQHRAIEPAHDIAQQPVQLQGTDTDGGAVFHKDRRSHRIVLGHARAGGTRRVQYDAGGFVKAPEQCALFRWVHCVHPFI
jgi:hypothetical protein